MDVIPRPWTMCVKACIDTDIFKIIHTGAARHHTCAAGAAGCTRHAHVHTRHVTWTVYSCEHHSYQCVCAVRVAKAAVTALLLIDPLHAADARQWAMSLLPAHRLLLPDNMRRYLNVTQ